MKICWHCMWRRNLPMWIAALAISATIGDFPPHPWGWLVILTKWPSRYEDHTPIGHASRKVDDDL